MKIIKKIFDTLTLKNYLNSNLSDKMAEKISTYNLDFSKYLITLSTSSIALTFAILQLLYKGTHINNIKVIRISWLLFTATILLGLIFNLLNILRIFFSSNAGRIRDNEKSIIKDINSEKLLLIVNNYNFSHNISRYSYLTLMLQTITFFCSIIFLVVFLTLNF